MLDIAVAGEDAPIVTLVEALLQWHAAICAHPRTPGFEAHVHASLQYMRDSFEPFAAVGVSLNTPKLHRAKDVIAVVRTFGGARIASTDTYEMAHKALKKVFLRYALSPVILPAFLLRFRCFDFVFATHMSNSGVKNPTCFCALRLVSWCKSYA